MQFCGLLVYLNVVQEESVRPHETVRIINICMIRIGLAPKDHRKGQRVIYTYLYHSATHNITL